MSEPLRNEVGSETRNEGRHEPALLAAIGNTPTVRLGALTAGLDAEIHVKLEMLNPGGSHKVRIAYNMVRQAELDGELLPGSGQTIIESTGGNTGMGMAITGALLGYRIILVIPDNYSPAKQRLLRAYGAEVRLSDHRLGNNSHAELAMRLMRENPDWVMLNQQANPANPDIHERTTALEILDHFGEDLPDVMVAGVGTGGHLTGVGRVLKAKKPATRISAVVPEGCSLLDDRFVGHDIQGLAIGLVPAVLETDLIDDEVPVATAEAVEMMRTLMRTEGLGVGISSAANIVAALRVVRERGPGTRIITFAYDGIHDYLDHLRE